MTATSSPVAPSTAPRWERIAALLLLALFVAIGLNNITHRAFIGQDFSFHLYATNHLSTHPDEWFVQDNTNRPLIYWLAIDGAWLTGNRKPFEFAALVFILCNAGALALLHDLARRVIFRPALRLAALAFIAFLPVTLITAVVFAADALTMPLFMLLGWSLVRWAEATARRDILLFAVLGGVALVAGNFAKFTFILLPVAALAIFFLLQRAGRVSRAHVLPFLVAIVLVPTAVGGWLWRKSNHALASQPNHHAFVWSGTGEMTWRSLLAPKRSDTRIFDAPTYWEQAPGSDPKSTPLLLLPNDYSYPALLHLGIFTDVMDFALNGSTDNGAPRPEPQKTASRWAVCTGVVFSALTLFAVAAFTVRTLGSLAQPAAAPATTAIVVGVMSLAWYLPLVLTLPFVRHAYDWGYWLPRLVLPALWGFFLELFGWFDRAADGRPRLRWVVVAGTGLQTALHLLVIWH